MTVTTGDNWRDELRPMIDYDFRKSYGQIPPKYRRHIADVIDLVAFWNKRMARPGKGGRNKTRIVTAERFRSIRQLLQVFSADEIAAAIDTYSRAKWQRQNKAWMTPDHFFTAARITGWIEQTIAQRERQALLACPKSPAVDRLTRKLAEGLKITEEA